MPDVVVFAYHNVGVRGLATLLAHGARVTLVVTHQDDTDENIWFESVAELAALNQIPVIAPQQPNDPETVARVRACLPEFIFSFYYRYMLGRELLAIPQGAAYNLHGSLLPRYRGRAPVNWAILHGERYTGASLHRMVEKPDAGDLVDQEAVPILPNDTAAEVLEKVAWAGELVLDRTLPELFNSTATHTAMDLSQGSYFGRRRPEDGRIDWAQQAWTIHNLVRAVAPPYPGAFFDFHGRRLQVLRSHYRGEPAESTDRKARIYWDHAQCFADCVDGRRLRVLELAYDGKSLAEPDFVRLLSARSITFEE